MQLLEDGVIAALAAFGLTAMLYLLLSAAALPRPRRRDALAAFAVVPCRAGDGAKLEYTVRALERARNEHGCFQRIVILDRGMDGETRQVAALLCRCCFGVTLCDDLSGCMDQE